jgi:hypothetical protein
MLLFEPHYGALTALSTCIGWLVEQYQRRCDEEQKYHASSMRPVCVQYACYERPVCFNKSSFWQAHRTRIPTSLA